MKGYLNYSKIGAKKIWEKFRFLWEINPSFNEEFFLNVVFNFTIGQRDNNPGTQLVMAMSSED